MTISEPDIKLLWGRAAGICCNPSCRADLTSILQGTDNYNVGEMAHIIAKSAKGPRGKKKGGSDKYENLLLLCPTCHRHIDKSPEGTYTVDQLHSWKQEHESSIRLNMSEIVFENLIDLKNAVSMLLIENHLIWEQYGPESKIAKEDLGSNAYQIWDLRKMDLIIPNNYKIINMVEANKKLLCLDDYRAFVSFKSHATSFEENQYCRLSSYLQFPNEFAKRFQL